MVERLSIYRPTLRKITTSLVIYVLAFKLSKYVRGLTASS